MTFVRRFPPVEALCSRRKRFSLRCSLRIFANNLERLRLACPQSPDPNVELSDSNEPIPGPDDYCPSLPVPLPLTQLNQSPKSSENYPVSSPSQIDISMTDFYTSFKHLFRGSRTPVPSLLKTRR